MSPKTKAIASHDKMKCREDSLQVAVGAVRMTVKIFSNFGESIIKINGWVHCNNIASEQTALSYEGEWDGPASCPDLVYKII